MKRRMGLVVFVVFTFSAVAWPKWKPEEQEYLDNQFRTIQDQLQALKKQLEALDAQLAEVKQNQAQFQEVLVRQERKLDDLEQLVSSLRIGNEEHFANLKTAVADLRQEQEKGFNTLSGHTAAGALTVTEATQPAPKPAVKGYVTQVQGSTLTIDLGSSQGMQAGMRLALYKATDLNTKVGEVEVTDVLDAASSRARLVSINPGVTPAFSDVVRPE